MPTTTSPTLTELVHVVREAIAVETDWPGTAELVAAALRANLPGPDVLTPAQREGDPDRYGSSVRRYYD